MKTIKYILLIIFLILIGFLIYTKFFHENEQITRSITKAPKYYTKGIEFYKERKYTKALREFDKAIQANPEYQKAYLKSAWIYIERQKYDEALAYFDKLIIQYPELSFPYFAKGLILSEKEDYESAIQNYQQAIQLNPKFAAVFSSLANAYYRADRLDEGIKWCNNIIITNPNDPYAFYGLAYAYKLQANWDQTFNNLNKASKKKPEFIEALHLKALSLRDTCNYEEALKASQTVLKLIEQKNELDLKWLILNTLCTIYYYLGQYDNALKCLEEALSITNQITDKYGTSVILGNLVNIYRELGDFSKAIEYSHQTIKLGQEMNDKETLSLAFGNLGDIYILSSVYDTALTYQQQSLVLSRELKDHLNEAKTLGAIAATYSYMSDYPMALDIGKQALNIYQKIKNKSGEASELGNLGAICIETGDYANALNYYHKALAISEQIKDLYNQQHDLCGIGHFYYATAEFQTSLIYFQRALKIAREMGDISSEANCLLNIGANENKLGNSLNSLKNLQLSLDLYDTIGDSGTKGSVYASMATIYNEQGRYDRAKLYYENSLEIAKKIRRRFKEAKTANELGVLYQKLEKYAEAITLHQQALKIGREIASLEIQYETNFALGMAFEKQRKTPEAIDFYKQAISIIENIRSDFELEEHKVTFFENKIEIYVRLIKLLFKLNQQKPNLNYDKEAFYYAEKAKARALLDLLTESKIDINQMLEPELQKRQKEIYQKISEILTDLRNEKLTVDQQNELNSQLKAEEDRLQTLQIEFRRKNPAYTSLQYATPLTIQTVQKEVLQKDELLLEYVLGETQSFLWAVDQKSCQIYALPSENEITKMVKRYIQTISHPPKPGITLQSEGKILFDLLLKPVTGLISNYQRLIIIPDAILFYLPYETLIHSTKKSKTGYLMETCEISYSPSTSVLHWLRQEQKRSATTPSLELLAFGDPIFGNEAASSTKRIPFSENPERGFYDQQGFDLARLPHTAAEIENIIQTLPAKSYVTHLRADAQEERVKSDDLHQYRRLHFATHGILDETLPGRSCIVLTLDDDPNEDGFLQVNEIFNLKLNADLVTLSACQTGKGKFLRGEGVLGLTRAFLYAGTNSVLVSLWSVNDRSTANLMTQFYQFLAQGKSKVQALQQAKLKLLTSTNPTLRHPYYWAGFVLIGNGGN